MSDEKRPCSVCKEDKRVTKTGLVYKHGACEGGGKEPGPTMAEDIAQNIREDALLAAVDEFRESLRKPVKTSLRERVSGWFHKKAGCCPDLDFGDDD